MSEITDLEIIKHFYNKDLDMTCGIYKGRIKGKDNIEIFIRNNNSVSVVSFLFGEPSHKCLLTVNNDVSKELIEMVDEILR
jgi:uncharacterized protein YcgL (UPF0745 family)